ncbi:small GTP-binding protein [Methanocaldococcus villosus KIN24-T80]|uniref:Small GTP-binding protein n=1 Tax=Methanocaldococcus villosus KIN24-T80 TaxID=1069083 RepID=N6VZ85_9EURY|nr:GTP-binding protein [Methanocaldococcus villosus]ENN96437.1 small GTP-binding protein [Methanocaldococcus villosus KIN24-T80]
MNVEEEIRRIEEELRRTPYNKATQKHIARLKAKLAKLREQAQGRKSGGGGKGYAVKKSGDATAAFVGFPSVGKSTLLNKLTNAKSEVGAYAFTTLTIVPGILEYKGAKIQLLDAPGIIAGASAGKGRGTEVLSAVRSADLILLTVDIFTLDHLPIIEKELYNVGIRLDQKPPDVKIKIKDRGGISVNSTVPLDIDEDEIRAILNEYKIHNADVIIREPITVEQFIDVVTGNRVYIPSLVVVNKIDLADENYIKYIEERLREFGKDYVLVSGNKGINLDLLKEKIYNKLGFIKIYLKPQGKKPDFDEPLIMRKGATVKDVCEKLHRDFVKNFRYALVWGKSVKHPGQRVGLDHKLEDEDILTIVIKR